MPDLVLLLSQGIQSVDVEVDAWALVTFIAYLLIIIGIGIYSARFSSKGLAHYFIGGREINRLVVALSSVVSGRSAWLLLGFTGMAYVQGASAVWAALGYTIVEFLLLFFYAPRIRSFTEAYDCITLPDFFSARFNDTKGYLRVILVIIIFIFLGSYISAQFVAGGKAFASSFGVAQNNGIIITAAIVVLYTVLGGFLAVSLTDVIQAFFMVIALLVLPVMAMVQFGGWGAVSAELASLKSGLVDPFAIGFGAMIGFLGIGLGSTGNPHIISRYMSIDDPKQLRFSAYLGTIWNVLMAAGAVLVGLVGRAYFPEQDMLIASDPENIYPMLAEQQLPSVIFGLIAASIFAAIMSTCDSQLLVVSSAVVRDIYDKLINKNRVTSQKTLVVYSRIVVVALVILALLMAFFFQELVFWLVLFAWAGVGAAIGPISILALFWRQTTWAGAMAGMLTGTAVTLIWYNVPALKESLYELIPAFIGSILVTIVVSWFTRPPENTGDMFSSMQGAKVNHRGSE